MANLLAVIGIALTVFGIPALAHAPIRIGASIAQTGMFQWPDDKKVIVWPEALASVAARFPTPPWSQRK